ncbi:Stk1 family PASTA domain-containing Ser/Thr kinase [Curtobacterium ammoniigenes]|uniref:Stk1 family PASTA domain-containing Ser/Thr kinase n=1 Tax=Curtobacterium ammoniigenes TaxID=395387 RepID=UPI00082B890D|nr:Stk1 family PASTA domain-containing Ser/Thr kinase [Curtobacterium ammoniigenes]
MTSNATSDPMIGRMIDQRYRVRSRIARGGMATVYLATDVRLERRVAIKIMHGHLADDPGFRNRFIQEARSAARLSHPNLVGVYDQGQEQDCTYIVMEYIPGITLRDLLHEHRALTSTQAVDILEAVLAGLASAHRAGIVHRDLKPENVLLADDGRIKLGDFGLARAASANTATGAALLGTIAYLSPELVTRGQADARSDIYAIGIMLYEMLTGEQPYKGEQPMQIAYQHAHDQVPLPSRAVPSVPPQLDDLVQWATERDPAARPHDARAMLDRVEQISPMLTERYDTAVLPRGDATTAVFAPATAGGAMAGTAWDDGPTSVVPPARPSSSGPTTTVPPVWPQPPTAGSGAVPTRAEQIAEGQVFTPAGQRLADKSARRRRRGWVLFAIVLAVALAAAGTTWWFGPGPGGNVRIPAVAGKTIAQATALLEARGLHTAATEGSQFDAIIPKGSVATTRPAAHRQVTRGTTVELVLSNGPRMISLPAIVGQPLSTVRAALAPNFHLQPLKKQFDDAAPDTVLGATGTNSDGSAVDLTTLHTYPQRGQITLTVSLGPVPAVTGKSLQDATTALQNVGLVVAPEHQQYSDTVPAGVVISATPSGSPVVQGSTVTLTVSRGPAPITLPDVTHETINRASSTLQSLGLKVTYPDCTNVLCAFYDWKATLPVSGTNPAPGTVVRRGDTITLDYKQ